MTPRSNSVEDCLLHFRQWSRRRLANQLLKAVYAKHFLVAVEHLDEPNALGAIPHRAPPLHGATYET